MPYLADVGTDTPFLGRASEMELLGRLVAEYRVVSLVGPGGIGKTRLAREFARSLERALEGNVLFATLVGASAQDDVAELAARTAGLASVDALYYGSIDRARVVVLDNCESALAGAARLVRALLDADPATRVVVTSRTPLGLPHERVVMVGSLALPSQLDAEQARSSPTVELFLDRARRVGALTTVDDDTVLDIARVVRQVDGMPLAIELAAARTRTLSPQQISTMLDRELGLLHRTSVEVDRHQSMRAVIGGSYEPLPAPVRRGFRALCLFDAPFDLQLAHGLMATSSELEAVEVLDELIRASLLVPLVDAGSEHRYRVLEPIRRFGLEQLEQAGELEDTIDRFIEVMARYADSFVAAVLTDFSPALFLGVNARHPHLVHAIDECVRRDSTADRANRLFLPLFGTARNRTEQKAAARRITETFREPAALHLETRAVMASVVTFEGDTPFARLLIDEVMADPAAGELPLLLAHRCLGFLDAYSGDLRAARVRFREAYERAEAISPAFARELECSLAATADTPDEVAGSLLVLEQAAEKADASGSLLVAHWANTIATELSVRLGELGAAGRHAERSLALAGRTGFSWSIGAAHKAIALARGAREGWGAAAPSYRRSFDAHVTNGDLFGAATTLRTAASQAMALGEGDLARRLWTSFPTGLGRSIVSPAYPDEVRCLTERYGTGSHPDLAAAIREVRRLFGEPATHRPAEATSATAAGGPTTDGGTVVRFADCELDLGRFELRRAGQRVPMEPQVFDVLAYLVAHRDRLVPKEELLDEIWGDRFVSESALTSRIKAARQATGDDGEAQHTIRTVRGRGYMFVGAVHGAP